MKRPLAALVAAGLLASVAATSAVAAGPSFTVVADGFAQPRQIAFGPGGRLYVTEAGIGGGLNPDTGQAQGFGMTGKLAVIRGATGATPSVHTIVSGLPSAVDEQGGAVGPVGVGIQGNGNIMLQLALNSDGTGLPKPVGRLLKVTPSGHWRTRADVGDIDYAWTLQHKDLAPGDFENGDANPYGVLAQPHGTYVVDAGANTLDWVGSNGHVKILAYFPNGAMHDATPTCVVRGPDHALYIGTLSLLDSLAFLDGRPADTAPAAKIWRVDPAATDPTSLSTVTSVATEWASGFWPITACAADGSAIYVTQFWVPGGPGPMGDVLRVPFADPTTHQSLTDNGLLFPTGVAIGPDHRVYVANNGLSADGQVVRLP